MRRQYYVNAASVNWRRPGAKPGAGASTPESKPSNFWSNTSMGPCRAIEANCYNLQ